MTTQSPNALLEAGIRAHSAGRLNEASELYERVLGASPDDLTALNNLGLLLGTLGQYARAEALLKRAMDLAPGYVSAYANLSVVLHAQQKFDEAIGCCERGLKLAPGNRKILNTLASSLAGAGRHADAIALLTRAMETHPDYAEGHHHIGTIHAQLGRYGEAAASFRRAAAANSRDVVSRVSTGECLLLSGNAGEALRALDDALRLSACDVRALALKTLALAELGRTDDERWLSDPHRLVHTHRLAELGYGPAEMAALNRRLSEFVSRDPSMREDPPEYATTNSWHSTTNLADRGDPAIAELRRFIAYAFEQRIGSLPREDPAHPFVRGAPRGFDLDLWAVRMLGGSKMLPHIHIDGWLSAVYYVEVPGIVDNPAAGEAGWLKLGTPRSDIRLTKVPITRTVKPEPGMMVTFPSYLWHDTVPLPAGNTEPRICLAFDLQPARQA